MHGKVGLLNEQENNSDFSSLLTEGFCLTCSLPYEAVEISLTCRILFLKTLPIYICFTSQKDVTFLLMQHLTKAMSEMCRWWGLFLTCHVLIGICVNSCALIVRQLKIFIVNTVS